MRCNEVMALMARLQPGGDPKAVLELSGDEQRLLGQLRKAGYIGTTERHGDAAQNIILLREQLRGTLGRRDAIVAALSRKEAEGWHRLLGAKDGEYRGLQAQRAALETQEQEFRNKILGLSEQDAKAEGGVETDAGRVALTYTGKELLLNLTPRMLRVRELDLTDFQRVLGEVVRELERRAQHASAILKVVSPRLIDVDEVHCRNAAVGLSQRSEAPDQLANAFVSTLAALRPYAAYLNAARLPMVAEAIVTGGSRKGIPEPGDAVNRLMEIWRAASAEFGATGEDSLTAAISVLPHPTAQARQVLERAVAVRGELLRRDPEADLPLSAAVSLIDSPIPFDAAVVERVLVLHRGIMAGGVRRDEAGSCAALLAANGGPDAERPLQRFVRGRDYLRRFGTNGMGIPAALLAMLGPSIEETLDDLRLAAGAISRNRLSLGGAENLSLGIKLLTQVALQPGLRPESAAAAAEEAGVNPSLIALGLAGVVTASAALVAAVTAFHERSLHTWAVGDYRFHPVHSHYIYG